LLRLDPDAKAPFLLVLHHLLNNISSTRRRIIDLILAGEDAEVTSYFPEYTELFNSVQDRLDRFIAYNERELESVRSAGYASREEIAAYVTKTICPGCLFSVIDGKSKSVKDLLYGMAVEFEQYIEKYV
jgi:hypothetical protein